MSSLEPFILRIKPAMDAFMRDSNITNLKKLENELAHFNWMHMSIFNVQILVPLVLKLDELSYGNQELRTGCLECITLVTSKVYLKELTALRTMLMVILKQMRERDQAAMKPNLSEEIKLAATQSISVCLKRSTTDVLEQFYCNDSSTLLGQILLTLMELIEKEKYKKIILASLECLLTVFYVHDEADRMDVVLRNQVANVLFVFLPKIITALHHIVLEDDKVGESIKINSIKALGRILCVMYEETAEKQVCSRYDVKDFTNLIAANSTSVASKEATENEILGINQNRDQLRQRMERMQTDGRTEQWIRASSKKIRVIIESITILRAHSSAKLRKEYAELCSLLILSCPHNLQDNFVYMLESVVALTEDPDKHIKSVCRLCINSLQSLHSTTSIFDESSDLLLDEHLTNLPRIIQRCDEPEQYAEFLFLKGFLKSLNARKLQLLLSIPYNLEKTCMCLLNALEMNVNINLLTEEYSIRDMSTCVERDYPEAAKLPWRSFKHIHSERCVQCVQDICVILGQTSGLNRILMDHLLEMLRCQNPAVNEILLLMLWIATAKKKDSEYKYRDLDLVKQLIEELLDDKHWYLALVPDRDTRIKTRKNTDWFVDRTPGLFESAIEVRTEDCDSDDEVEDVDQLDRVTMIDAEFNVLHTCIVLDCLGNCSLYIGERFDGYIFKSMHKVLMKLAQSNCFVYQAACFGLISMQKALRFSKVTELIENYTDYLTYHLNNCLKRVAESNFAIDILTVTLHFSSRDTLPHLESIFQTIHDQCCRSSQTVNIACYLRVFNAFLCHITTWMRQCKADIGENTVVNCITETPSEILSQWIEILEESTIYKQDEEIEPFEKHEQLQLNVNEVSSDAIEDEKNVLPLHVEITKAILLQATKFINSTNEQLQILSIECFTCGLPLLNNYENELLPLVHKVWTPLVEKFRQRNALVLNRCFTLLTVLAICAKEFITKRTIDDILPFLKKFLQTAASHSRNEIITAKTQEYKLQLKLLKDIPNLIQCLDLDGKVLNDISDAISEYLSQDQPIELQSHAIKFYINLRLYDGPLIYLSLLKISNLEQFEKNVHLIFESIGIK